ncbi:HD domain-containing protein [Acidaminococcus intestini]|nr:HD domain-containing protein [Acidaminococcus intestini]
MEILRKNILDTFKSYVDGFCGIGPGVNLKYAHSLRVAALSERIAQSLSMEKEDIDLAWLIGILHDIGRFEQLRRYQTFFDYRSMDHAKYGVHVLLRKAISRILLRPLRKMTSSGLPLGNITSMK